MNHKLNAEAELLDSTLAHHVHLHLPVEGAVGAAPQRGGTLSENSHTAVGGAENSVAGGGASFSEMGVALYNLLIGYVELLEGQGHGAWTLQEETVVGEAVTALSRSGWTRRLPQDISLEALKTRLPARILP